MGIKEIKNCAESALDLGDSIEKLNLSNFGAGIIDDKLDKFGSSCIIDKWEKDTIRNTIAGGIYDIKQEKYEWAKNSFKLAREQVFGSALTKIKEKF